MKRYLYIPLLCIVSMAAGCSKKSTDAAQAQPETPEQLQIASSPLSSMPKATAFKMSGDYADNVAVTLNSDGTLLYYPAPSDITSNSAPYALGDGWYLNRQGVSSNSVFTKWTFEEYSRMKQTPTRREIMDAIIPGAKVIEMIQLPVSLSDALADPAACLQYVK